MELAKELRLFFMHLTYKIIEYFRISIIETFSNTIIRSDLQFMLQHTQTDLYSPSQSHRHMASHNSLNSHIMTPLSDGNQRFLPTLKCHPPSVFRSSNYVDIKQP